MLYINIINTIYSAFLNIEWRDIRYFILGILTGIVLLILSLVFIFSRNERKKTKARIEQGLTLDDKIILDMIEAKQEQLDKTVRLTDNGYFKVAIDLSLELTEEIARYYFPKSRYPLYELSFQEMLNLSYYITQRVDDLLNGKVFKLFKNYRIASIIDILNTRKKINSSKLMQITRKIKLQQIYSASRTVLNYGNPIYWFRKLAIKPTAIVVTKEVCKYIITFFGEETNNIYSKAIFKEADSPDEIIEKLDSIIEEKED